MGTSFAAICPQMARAVLEARLPVIDVRGGAPEAGLPLVAVDNARVVDAAFEHDRQRGFRHFAWFEFCRKPSTASGIGFQPV